MAITTTQISERQKDKLLSIHEGHFADLKRIEVAPAKLTRTVSAFANTDGGDLYIGIEEDKTSGRRNWHGFTNEEAANGHIQAIEAILPLGQYISYEFLACRRVSGSVLYVTIRKTRDIVTSSDGTPYVRRGAQNLPVNTSDALVRLRLGKGITSFETETLDTDPLIITNSVPILRFMLDVVPSAEPEDWLRKQILLQSGKPTVAGILLFAEVPQALLPKRCAIKIYRYKTKNAEGRRDTLAFDPITIEGCLYDQITAAVRRTVEIIEDISVLGDQGLEHIKYPTEALHEIITNAVLHRDYSITTDVHVRIFDNRIEIESPGRLAGHVTVDNILQEQFARNGTIVRMINKFPNPPNKDVGEGLNTAFEAMRKLRLKDPIVEQRDNSVIVYIRHEPLATPEEIVMTFLETHDQINNSKGRELCHIGSENVMKLVFQRLIKAGLIERVPGLKSRASAYRKMSAASTMGEPGKLPFSGEL